MFDQLNLLRDLSRFDSPARKGKVYKLELAEVPVFYVDEGFALVTHSQIVTGKSAVEVPTQMISTTVKLSSFRLEASPQVIRNTLFKNLAQAEETAILSTIFGVKHDSVVYSEPGKVKQLREFFKSLQKSVLVLAEGEKSKIDKFCRKYLTTVVRHDLECTWRNSGASQEFTLWEEIGFLFTKLYEL